MRVKVLTAVLVTALLPFGTVPGAQAAGEGRYISAGVAVARADGNTPVDNGAVVCDDGNGVGVGGVCLPFGGGNAISVVDDVLGEAVALQVCVDNNGDNVCTPNDPDPYCADDVVFSHDDDGSFYNPVGPVPTGFRPGCPGGGWNGYVVYLCDGAHAVSADVHAHPATTGIATVTSGGEGLGTFCGGPSLIGKPYYGTYVDGNLGCGVTAVLETNTTGQNAEGTLVGGPWHSTGPVTLSCSVTVNGTPTVSSPGTTGFGVASSVGRASFSATLSDVVEVCTDVVTSAGPFHRCLPVRAQVQGDTVRWILLQPVY